MKYPGARIVLMTREPVAGCVKTRLIPSLGVNGALVLFEKLLYRQISVLCQQHFCRAALWVDGDPGAPVFRRSALACFRQQGDDLGERMHNAASAVLAEDDVVILIGSDCPDLDEDYLEHALQALYSGMDVVVGPALDGGYVLIGLRRADPVLFEGIEWGTNRVLHQTIERIQSLALEYLLLTPLGDIDRPEDLQAHPELLMPHTAQDMQNRSDLDNEEAS